MKGTKNPAAFLHTFWCVVITIFLCVGTFNALVDPFGMFDLMRIPGFNELKPEMGSHARMAKAYRIRQLQPHGIILGSSRAEIGLDPDHPGWDEKSHPVYNLALPGARIDEVRDYLFHAQAHGPLNEIVLALDFFMFNANWRHAADFDDARLSQPGQEFSDTGWLNDPIRALFSMDGLKASYETIQNQNKPVTSSYYTNGLRDTSRKWTEVQSSGGHRNVFLASIRYDLTHPDGWPLFALHHGKGSDSTINTFKDIVHFCHQNDINLRVFISPIHALQQEVIWQLGLAPQYESWKRELVEILDSREIDLWDFSGYNRITIEPFPQLGDTTTQMKNYWEGSHYRRHIGNRILNRLFEYEPTGLDFSDDFGVRLDSSNIEAHLQSTRHAREGFLSAHQQDAEEIKKLILDTTTERDTIVRLNANRHGESQ
jgi:hypothetical protein